MTTWTPEFSRQHAVEIAYELAGTTLLTVIGLGAAVQAAAVLGPVPAIPWAWAIGLAFGIYVAAPGSGGHVNPAITLSLAVWHGFPWRKVPGYLGAQVVGAAAGALIVRVLGADVLGGAAPAGAVFVAVPVKASDLTALLFGIVGTAVLVFGVGAVLGTGDTAPPRRLQPMMIGLLAGVIGVACGPNTALNPATDIGPRLVAFLSGYEPAFLAPDGRAFWWVPLVGPLLGGVVGAGLFAALVVLAKRAAEDRPVALDEPTGPQPALPQPELRQPDLRQPDLRQRDLRQPTGPQPLLPQPVVTQQALPRIDQSGIDQPRTAPVPLAARDPWPMRPTWGPPPPGWTVHEPIPGPPAPEPVPARVPAPRAVV